MKDRSSGYRVVFSVDAITLRQQEEIYDLLRKNLSFDMKDHLSVMVEDPIGGKHDLWQDSGIDPKGGICKKCATINCEFCHRYKEDKNGKQSNTK